MLLYHNGRTILVLRVMILLFHFHHHKSSEISSATYDTFLFLLKANKFDEKDELNSPYFNKKFTRSNLYFSQPFLLILSDKSLKS